jgi:hypothetical protein
VSFTSPVQAGQLQPSQISLVDLLDRLLSSGVVLSGEVTLSIADIELVTISLRALLASASTTLSPPDEELRSDEAGEPVYLPGAESG